ncbi:hypothetical protein FACS1894193_08670 [Bacilli bacterium]|nr:hypothetical protein FACS1894193_08670 [Bacilli bacterium]
MENEITVLGQLGLADKQAAIKKDELPQTSKEQARYTVQQQSEPSQTTGLLPLTGELQQVGVFMFGLLLLILTITYLSKSKSKISAQA